MAALCMIYVWCLLVFSQRFLSPCHCGENLRRLSGLNFTVPGRLMLGMLTDVGPYGEFCTINVRGLDLISSEIAAIDAIEAINADSSILGNISLGLASYDECLIPKVALGKAMAMVAGSEDIEVLGVNSKPGSQRVVGVIGPSSSGSSMAVAPLLNLFDVPMISWSASSDELNDRSKYPNFFRMVPADSFQAGVMVDIMASLNWTYISVVYIENGYGFNGLKFLRHHTRKVGICIAQAVPTPEDLDSLGYETLVKRLKHEDKAKVVVVFAFSLQMESLLGAAKKLGYKDFIWILSEVANENTFVGMEDISQGSMIVNWYTPASKAFQDSIETKSLSGRENNPYFAQSWQQFLSCDFEQNNDQACVKTQLKDIPAFHFYTGTVLTRDAVNMFAKAIDTLVSNLCPEKLTNSENIEECVKPRLVRDYLKDVELETEVGKRSFNEKGEGRLDFKIRQLQSKNVVVVGIWKQSTAEIEWNSPFRWSEDADIPESVCAKPCAAGEVYLQGELTCCWTCHRCRNNEYVTKNATTCQLCPSLTWPDDVTYETCLSITPSLLTWSDAYGASLTALGSLGLLATLAIITIFIRQRHRRVVKGAGLEMMTIILIGLLLGFGNVPLFIVRPNDIVCVVNKVIFSLASTLIFTPLLLKTWRVYLVFSASAKLTRVSRGARASVLYTLTALLLLVFAGLIVATVIFWPIHAMQSMPIATLKYVELHCQQDQIGLLVPLSYNLCLMFLCSILAFLTRKLPDNFNESWYVFLSVSTTLFIWVAFLPTYYAAFFAYHKAALLALATALNGCVIAVCLFGPKIYALFFISESAIKITDFDNTSFEKTETTQVTTPQ